MESGGGRTESPVEFNQLLTSLPLSQLGRNTGKYFQFLQSRTLLFEVITRFRLIIRHFRIGLTIAQYCGEHLNFAQQRSKNLYSRCGGIMARLHEHQGKTLLEQFKINIPSGKVAHSPGDVRKIAAELDTAVVLKAQAWTTGRAAIGGIQFADTPQEAYDASRKIFGKKVGNFSIDAVLVEEKLDIVDEFYGGIIIDDQAKQPLLIFSSIGGSGIEEIVQKYPDKVAREHIDVVEGLKDFRIRNVVRKTGITGKAQLKLGGLLEKLIKVAIKYEARSAEINPIVLTSDGKIYAADCRITVDDYAVFRHPDLGIEVAREFNRPPTELDLISYNVEKGDYRGTFYFIQMEDGFTKGDKYIGFHGAGGGGSMMSMDAVDSKGYKIANFCDTSGNPPASKVYRAAKIILAQQGIDGYFGSGSGVASQEQFHSARGLVKAFREEQVEIPVVIRLGGNSEELAVDILENYTKDLPAPVEGYKKDDSVDFCAERFDTLVKEHKTNGNGKAAFTPPVAEKPYMFETMTGTVRFDHNVCLQCENQVCVEKCVPQILQLDDGLPILNISKEEAKKGKCTECLACEVECAMHGAGGGYVHLPIEGLDDYLRKQPNSPKA
ncbi:MAG: Succinate--CoA ligase [GDP-forming] subunit beta [Candidatus Marinimicrobia bacterium]|nr:Succinate--CoA ligase [GDP-forming] subunit beta [Candidatus Neomarinimicrobiota bacterium]